MRLADELQAAVGTFNDAGLGGAITSLVSGIARAEAFELTPEVQQACNEVSQSKPSSLISAMPLTRLPYARTWVEWMPASQGVSEGSKPMPIRIGCLLESDSALSQGQITWAWCHRAVPQYPHLMVAPFGINFDWGPEGDMVAAARNVADALDTLPADLRNDLEKMGFRPDAQKVRETAGNRLMSREQVSKEMTRIPKWSHLATDPTELQAAIDLQRRTFVSASLHCVEFWRRLNLQGFHDEAIMQGWIDDITGEYSFITAFIMLLNAKNGLVQHKEDLSTLNKARQRRGRAALHEFIVTSLALSKVVGNRATSYGMSRAAARKHLVRGHFKICRGGIFWWSPHIRGKGSDVAMRHHYDVRSGVRLAGGAP